MPPSGRPDQRPEQRPEQRRAGTAVKDVKGSATGEEILARGGTVIAATHRIARQVRQRHDRARAASGARAWPTADVVALDAWLRRTWEALAVHAPGPGPRRLLADDESRLVWQRVIAGEGEERLDASVVVPLVAAAWHLCQMWGITADNLRDAAESEDTRTFARWTRAYAGQLERRGWLDGAGLLRELGQVGRDPGLWPADGPPVGFAGFEPWTPALQQVAERLEAGGTSVWRIAPPRRQGEVTVVCARNADDELACAFAWAAQRSVPGDGSPPAIVIPDLEQESARVRRIGLEVLAPGWQLREPVVRPLALAVGRQLGDYPVVSCALMLLELVAFDLPFEQASLLLRSAYVAGADAERGGRARAELELRRIPVERFALPDLLAVLGSRAPGAAARWQQAALRAGSVRDRRLPPGRWAGHFADWLAASGWPGDRGLGSEEFQAVEAWQRLLESFAAMDEVAGTLSVGAALRLLAQLVRDRPFEPESAVDAIQLLTPREAEGQDFRALWICGMTADKWPPPARPHPLIPLGLQRSAGIPEAMPTGVAAATKRRFDQLLAAADRIVLSWPAEQDEAATLPSPLLAGLPVSPGLPGTVALHPDRDQLAGADLVEEVAADPPPPLATGQAMHGGARVLAMQAVCPARAFVEFRLRASPLEPPARPLDAAARGTLVHALLEHLYRLQPCARGLGLLAPEALRPLFEGVVGGALDQVLRPGQPLADGLRRIETERLWSLVLSLRALEVGRPGFSVSTELSRNLAIGPLSLRVRLDRVDRQDAGGELVIDYKTGRFDPVGWKRPRLAESQLPLYAVSGGSDGIAVIQLRAPAAQLRGVGADTVSIDGMKTSPAFFREEGLDWPATLQRWRSQLEMLAEEFAAGDFRVNPADRRWAVGQFAGLTRIHEFLPTVAGDDPPEDVGE